ncbi:protein Hook homolog 2-like isoform X2 [Agelaius tricolor]|uniref:protein Hook homolog 2-like isoform X2 n=1 Tax=Agelaius tricolor TaxID=9191 RepID=UPI0039F21CD8
MAAGRDACGALLTWLQTFDPPSPCAAPPDLASGVTLAHVLHQIDPSWFDEAWLGRIRGDTEGSARLKVNNLRQVLQSVLEYWQDVLGQAVGEQHVPDVGAAARHGDPEQLRRLVRLVLGCAVSCQRREEHIQRIMTLEESVQHEVMTAIQELLDPEPSEPMAAETYGNFDAQSRRYYYLSQEPPEEGSGQRCRELEQQVRPGGTWGRPWSHLGHPWSHLGAPQILGAPRFPPGRGSCTPGRDPAHLGPFLHTWIPSCTPGPLPAHLGVNPTAPCPSCTPGRDPAHLGGILHAWAPSCSSGRDPAHLGGSPQPRAPPLHTWESIPQPRALPAHLGGILHTWAPPLPTWEGPLGPVPLPCPPGPQVATLLEEKGHLAAENRALREQLEAEGAGAAAKKLLRLQAQVEELQEENYRLESGREELRARCSRLEQEARGLQARAQELSGLAGEARALRDEMDLLRASSARAGRLEAAVAAYRGRAAAAGELRRWARALEERHAAQVRRAAHLQQQLGRAQAGCAQLEAARKQVEELSGQQAEAALRAEKWHLEFRHLQERFEALSQEKERLLEERDALREANEELRCVQVQQSYLSQAGAGLEEGPAPPQNLAAEILPAELRDTVTRLRRENRRLRLQRDQLRHRLEATGAAEPQTAQGGPQEELVLLEETPEDLDELPEGEEEEEEEELELSKAGFRSSRSSPPQKPSGPPGDPPGTPPLAPVLQLLRSQLQEKDALIRHLENDWERSRAQREREERLLVTAWYNMGLALQQHEGDATAAAAWGGPGGARSFLAQQRLATAARRARAPHGRAASSS